MDYVIVCVTWTHLCALFCMCVMDCIVSAVCYICIKMCSRAASVDCPPAHRSPSHFALILQWLDKKERADQ